MQEHQLHHCIDMSTLRPPRSQRSASLSDERFTLAEAQALVGRTVRAKRARPYQIADGVQLQPYHTGTVIGVDGEYTTYDEPPRIVLAVQIWPPSRRQPRKQHRDFVLRLDGKVIGRIPYDGGLDPLPCVVLLDRPTFETYLSLIS